MLVEIDGKFLFESQSISAMKTDKGDQTQHLLTSVAARTVTLGCGVREWSVGHCGHGIAAMAVGVMVSGEARPLRGESAVAIPGSHEFRVVPETLTSLLTRSGSTPLGSQGSN